MLIKPKFKNFICTTAHPHGCKKNIEDDISYIKKIYKSKKYKKKNVLIIGSSTGYGLITRLISTFGYNYNTIGLSKEKEPSEKKTATPGWYNTTYLEYEAKKLNIYTKSFNKDTFSNKTKNDIIQIIKNDLDKIDILIYSIAASKYTDETLKKTYTSSLKPCTENFTNKTFNLSENKIIDSNIKKANNDEIFNTIKLMGGEDWYSWINTLRKNNLINTNFKTIAYSYNGPKITHAIYKNGTIGLAKKHLFQTALKINKILKHYNGYAYISINEAIMSQASLSIPSVPLYLALFNNIKNKKKLNKNSIDYIKDLFSLINKKRQKILITLNKTEMQTDIQNEIETIWHVIKTENIEQYIDLKKFKNLFLKMNGFKHNNINYNIEIDPLINKLND